ncbi:DUF4232 domain-containing protein [Streptomyces sp. NBC_00237]|uniref:DUF4232 domain-containing protein n=1 Tax=Streptomyces sp. NBC_00237 TaxID=2975687 RepID=UPI00225BAE2A|nr:DUF4232 domain-containing protein [Streptomyces sp. NBC_00237]MCX5205037.1 DUF4232 domain-containing protein [Streptomyces sp. NBC_00237]
MSARTARRSRLFAAASVALVATLSLTACQNGDGSKDAGPARTSSPSADGKPAASGTAGGGSQQDTQTGSTGKSTTGGRHTDKGTSSGTNSGSTTGKGSTSSGGRTDDPHAPANRARCDASRIKVTAQVVSRPLNTMILTATNTGSKLCDLFYAPVVRFEGAQSVPPSMKDTQPQAVVSLKPGESGYAAVKLSSPTGTPDPGYTATSLSIGFYDMDHRNLDGFAPTALPAKGVYIDGSIRVSFWQSSLDDVSSL